MEKKITILQNEVTGDRKLLVVDNGVQEIGIIPRTKWKAVQNMQSAIVDLCGRQTSWETVRSDFQSLVEAAPSVPPGDISAQVFDRLKRWRVGTPLGDLLKRAAEGDHCAVRQFDFVAAREEMIRAFGSHIIRFTSVIGEGLGSGILLLLPDASHAIMTCSHVWTDHLAKQEQIQMLCASAPDCVTLNQQMIQVPVKHLSTLDLADPDFMQKAGIDALLYKRDSAIIAGDFRRLIPAGARAFDLRSVSRLEPEAEEYALVGYPLAAKGELAAQFLEYSSRGRNNHVFVRHTKDSNAGSLNGASGGMIVALRHGRYRPVALMVEENGSVEEAGADSCQRSKNPSAFHALPLVDLRTMIERVGKLTFRDREGRIVRECPIDGNEMAGSLVHTGFGAFPVTKILRDCAKIPGRRPPI